MKNKIREHLKKHFAIYIMVTNALCALGVAALTVIGVFSSILSTTTLVLNAGVFGLIYAVGKFGNEQLEDLPKIEIYEAGNKLIVEIEHA